MAELFIDTDLRQISDAHFAGHWQVVSRGMKEAVGSGPLALATHLQLAPTGGALEAHIPVPGPNPTGTWTVVRDELLNRPYLRFSLPADNQRALVTRLRRSPDGERSQLNLYFASGMEMQLEKA